MCIIWQYYCCLSYQHTTDTNPAAFDGRINRVDEILSSEQCDRYSLSYGGDGVRYECLIFPTIHGIVERHETIGSRPTRLVGWMEGWMDKWLSVVVLVLEHQVVVVNSAGWLTDGLTGWGFAVGYFRAFGIDTFLLSRLSSVRSIKTWYLNNYQITISFHFIRYLFLFSNFLFNQQLIGPKCWEIYSSAFGANNWISDEISDVVFFCHKNATLHLYAARLSHWKLMAERVWI